MQYIKKDILKKVYRPRPKDSHKYDFGYLIVVGGSQLYSGSPALVAMAALRTGVDLTLVIAPERAANIIASFSPNLISYPLKGHDLGLEHLSELLILTETAKKVSHKKAALAIGGGIGRDKKTQKAINEYLSKIDLPAIIDADAIWAISKEKQRFKGKKFVLTPHLYEFFVLSGIDLFSSSQKEKIEAVKKIASEFSWTIVLKGNIDIITDGKKVLLNRTGTPSMTVGGTGDTLSGICGCFLAQGFDPLTSASVASYINGKAGELAARNFKEGLLATDLIEFIPKIR